MSTWNLGKRNGPGLVKPSMNSGNPAKTHIAPERLWQSACGGAELQSSEYLHLVGCVSCDKLADEISEALDDIQDAVSHSNAHVS